ncbi:MAG: hypothetical protein HQ567_23330 [Candidatus Nealsonbacteria bacterium]|nr:hypothetical protein [Candidatus Nealsonbacteria bacterium]
MIRTSDDQWKKLARDGNETSDMLLQNFILELKVAEAKKKLNAMSR